MYSKIYIVTVHQSEDGVLNLRSVLQALGPLDVAKLTWGIAWLDWLADEDGNKVNQVIDASSDHRLLLSGTRLLDLSQRVHQVLEGVFVGYFSEVDAAEFMHTDWSLTRFANSSAQVAIEAIDGSYFDVYLRSSAMMDHLAQVFKRVQRQDPANFLERYDSSEDGTNPT